MSVRSHEATALARARAFARAGGWPAPGSMLCISALAKSFHAGTHRCSASASVLRNVDLELWPGESIAIDGARGSGCSTLLRCACGLLRPSAGSVRWFGAGGVPRALVAYVGVDASIDASRGGSACGAMYADVARALSRGARLLLVDDLDRVGAFERRLIFDALQVHARAGGASMLVATLGITEAPFIERTFALANGTLIQRRNRSAARMVASSPLSRARASARSTCGRSLRSPQ